jgi:hypothetical protein
MKLFILAVLCSIAALTWGESDVKDASSLIKGNSALDDVKDASSLIKGNSALDDVKDASSLKNGNNALDDINTRGDILYQGYELLVGGAIRSPDGRYVLVMQGDGNLVLYKIPESRAIWASNTYDSGGVKAVLQYDGDFVVYSVTNNPRWNSGTSGRPSNYLRLQDDGNLVLYGVGDNVPQWSTGTWEKNTLRTESFNSASIVNMGKLTTQEAMPPILSGPVHFDKDPISVPDKESNRTLRGIN